MPTPQSAVQVSVIMVTYKTGPILWQAIDSVFAQAVNCELVIVDNGNPSEDSERLREIERGRSDVTVIAGHGNVGFSRGCNMGAEISSGAYLLFMNPDCVLFPDCLEQFLAAAGELPQGSLVGGDLLNANGERCANTQREFPTPWRLVVESLRLDKLAPRHPYFRRLRNESDLPAEGLMKTSAVSGALMFLSRGVYKEVNGFDEAFFLHVEDIDICMRLHLMGFASYYCAPAKAIHYQSSSDVSWFSVEVSKAQSFSLYFKKHFSEFYPGVFMILLDAVIYSRLLARMSLKVLSLGYLPSSKRIPSIDSL